MCCSVVAVAVVAVVAVVVVVVVVVVVAVFDANFQAESLCQQTLRINCAGALDGKELFTIEGSEKWRSTADDLEEREKWPKK